MNLFSVHRAWEICRPQAENHWSTKLCAITCHACKLLPSETNSIMLYNAQLVCLPRGKNILAFPVLPVFSACSSKWQQVTFRVCTSYRNVENSLSIKLSARAPEIDFSRSTTESQRPWSQNWFFISITFCIQGIELNSTELLMNIPLARVFPFCEIQSFLVV